MNIGEPFGPAGQIPVPVAKQRHGRRYEDRADDGRIQKNSHAESESNLLQKRQTAGREAGKDGDHDQGRAGYDPRRLLQASCHRYGIAVRLIIQTSSGRRASGCGGSRRMPMLRS